MSDLEKLKDSMSKGFVKFIYQKIDGSSRVAIGTRNSMLIKTFNGEHCDSKHEQNPYVFPYFDLVKGGWRCFKINLFDRICYNNDNECVLSNELASVLSIVTAINNTEFDIECTINNIKTLIGEKECQKIVNYVCDNRIHHAEECLYAIFHKTNKELINNEVEITSNINNRLESLCREEMKLKKRLDEIDCEKRKLLNC